MCDILLLVFQAPAMTAFTKQLFKYSFWSCLMCKLVFEEKLKKTTKKHLGWNDATRETCSLRIPAHSWTEYWSSPFLYTPCNRVFTVSRPDSPFLYSRWRSLAAADPPINTEKKRTEVAQLWLSSAEQPPALTTSEATSSRARRRELFSQQRRLALDTERWVKCVECFNPLVFHCCSCITWRCTV